MTSAARQSRKKKALGRGLEALLPDAGIGSGESRATLLLDPESIMSNPFQPRQSYDETELAALASSIRSSGLLQPLLVRRMDGGYQLIAGERRLRAARMAGLERVPALVRDASNAEMLALALIENLQRRDLGPMEKAAAFRRLATEFDLTQDELARAVGLSRPAVANFMRLVELPIAVQELLRNGSLSMGHGRALLGMEDDAACERLARRAVKRGSSVRALEEAVRAASRSSRARPGRKKTPEQLMLEQRLERHLGTRVRVYDNRGTGRIEIAYSSLDELDRILEIIGADGRR